MKYKALINELYSKRTKGIKLGLERVSAVLEKLGNPHDSFLSIHIAGTNGKGSVSKIIYSLLRAHGFRVGLFTSPHLTRFTERILVNDEEISEDNVINLIEKIKPYGEVLTFFEYVTIMAFLYFQEMKVDYVVVETGMGGRLDATNVVKPEVSVITSIGIDHQEFLGTTLSSIAQEKAGIIKKGIPIVSASQDEEAEDVISKKAREMNSPLFVYGKHFHSEIKLMDFDGIIFDFYPYNFHPSDLSITCGKSLSPSYDLHLSLTGVHQKENASLALKAFMNIYNKWEESAIRKALKSINMPGRLEVVCKEPLIILDIAHNPPAVRTLVNSLKELTQKKPVVVFGIMKDKDVLGVLKEFENYAEKIFFTSAKYERALKYEDLLNSINGFSKNIQALPDSLTAFKKGVSLCKENRDLFLLCTGSAYLIGELKEALGEKSSLRNLGEII